MALHLLRQQILSLKMKLINDDIPLNQLASILGKTLSMDVYVNIVDKLQATEAMSDNDILFD
jgi:hypothetical protein